MRCYYRNSIGCGANRRDFEDQSVIKGKIKIKWDKTKLVSHLGDWEGGLLREEKRRRRRRKRRGFQVWIAMALYGMDSWILDLVFCLRFCYEKF